jgi:hypothetical protein
MKTPFRLQASEHDCVPTTFLNAVSYLFDREEIPPLVIQKIYIYCLDTVTSRQNIGHGTSGVAVQLLGNWLGNIKTAQFSVATEYLAQDQIHFRGNNKISRCANSGGVALLRVHYAKNYWHYILVFSVKDGVAYCFDPYPRRKKEIVKGKVRFVEQAGPQSPNLEIAVSHLDTRSNTAKYVLGTATERECLLITRK